MSNLKKIPLEQTTLSNDFSNTYKSEVDTTYTNNHTHSNKSILDTVSGSNTGDETISTILTKVCANKITCSTDSATTEKTVSISGFSLVSGVTIKVKFTSANTATSPTLNVSSTGAKAIYSEDGVIVSATNPFYVPAGATVEFTYDGANWVYKNRIISNYINGATWYQRYSNGRIRQGGRISAPGGGSNAYVTYSLSFLDTNHSVMVTCLNTTIGSNNGLVSPQVDSRTTSGCVIHNYDTDSSCGYEWIAEGY